MGYIYEKARESLGGKTLKPNTVIKDWSPNLIRTIVIGVDYIFVAKHIGSPTLISLNRDEVSQDVEKYINNIGKGNLTNLFSERQFSCLEEVYIDQKFVQLQGLFNLQMYIDKVTKDSSRIRSYGVGNFGTVGTVGSTLVELYKKAGYDFLISDSLGKQLGITFKTFGKDDWYKKYLLRPQYYQLDKEGGRLCSHFRKCQLEMEKRQGSIIQEKAESEKSELILKGLAVDMEENDLINDMRVLLAKLLKSKDELHNLMAGIVKGYLKERKKIGGINPNCIAELMPNTDKSRVDFIQSMVLFFRVFEESGTTDMDLLKEKSVKGFFDFEGFLKSITKMILESKTKYTKLIRVTFSINGLNKTGCNAKNYVNFLYELAGYERG